MNGKVEKSTFNDIYADKDQGLMLRLNLREHQSINMVDETAINSKEAIMSINKEGTMFAIFMTDSRQIKIVSIEQDRIHAFIHKIKRI